MSTKPILRTLSLLAVVVIIAISLAACRQPASTPLTEANPTPTEGMGPFVEAATQTAMPTGQVVPPTAAPNEPASQGTAAPSTDAQPTSASQAQPTAEPTKEKQDVSSKVYPTLTPGIPKTYTLQKDEHAYCIARRFNLDPFQLMSLNGIGPSTVLSPGTVLKIPQTGSPFVADRALLKHPALYTVQAGDSIYKIACAFGDVSPDMIALVNGLKEPYTLKVGDKLEIP